LAPEDGGTTILPNVFNHTSSDSTLHPQLHGYEYVTFRTVKILRIYGTEVPILFY